MDIDTKKFDERFKKASDVFKSSFENRKHVYSREMDRKYSNRWKIIYQK